MKNELLVMVLTDLAAICKKLAENSGVPEELRVKARGFAAEFNSLLPVRGKGTAAEHAQGEQLIIKIARFYRVCSMFRPGPAQMSHSQRA